jgi:hypothetical protein
VFEQVVDSIQDQAWIEWVMDRWRDMFKVVLEVNCATDPLGRTRSWRQGELSSAFCISLDSVERSEFWKHSKDKTQQSY